MTSRQRIAGVCLGAIGKNMRVFLAMICMPGIASPVVAGGIQQMIFAATPTGFVLNGMSPAAESTARDGVGEKGEMPADVEAAMRELFQSGAEPQSGECVMDRRPPDPGRGFGNELRSRRAGLWQWVRAAECRHGLPAGLLDALVLAESRYQVNAVSPVGAGGLTQLMPATAKELGVVNRFDPIENIDGGARYLRAMLDRFGAIVPALAAYNAGPAAVMRHGGVPPYRETRGYVRRVTEYWQGFASGI